MQVVYDMGNGMRMVDLSKLVDPATETRRCNLYRFNTGGPIPDFHTNFDIMSHLGTHAECPYHHDDNWPDVTALPLTTFVGRGVYVDFKDTVAPYTHITKADLDRVAYKVKKAISLSSIPPISLSPSQRRPIQKLTRDSLSMLSPQSGSAITRSRQ